MKEAARQRPSSAPAPPRGAPGGSGQLGTPQEEDGPLSTRPLPRVPEPAASKVADFTASGRAGAHCVPRMRGQVPKRRRCSSNYNKSCTYLQAVDPNPNPNPSPNPNLKSLSLTLILTLALTCRRSRRAYVAGFRAGRSASG